MIGLLTKYHHHLLQETQVSSSFVTTEPGVDSVGAGDPKLLNQSGPGARFSNVPKIFLRLSYLYRKVIVTLALRKS